MSSSSFKQKVIDIVNLIPSGRVASYGQIALYLGMPRAARQVGWILNKLDEESTVPWWRVVNNQGRISIKGSKYSPFDQKAMLESEGIEVGEDLTFEIEKYRFFPDETFIKKLHLDPDYLEMISTKAAYSSHFWH